MNKVIIGVVAKHRDINKLRTDTLIRDEIKDSIFYNNAVAIGIVPPSKKIKLVNPFNEKEIYENLDKLFTSKEEEDLIAQINLCNGVILSGGISSDAYEMWIAKYCYENDIPILAICAGENNLVRAVGGSVKDCDAELHNQQTKDYVHSIKIKKSSKLFNMLGVESLQVNSRHKRVINNPGKLKVVAVDENGNIEAVEDKNKNCFLGVRFHPESLYLVDELHNRLIKSFIDICNEVKNEKII